MNPQKAKELYDKIEEIALVSKSIQDSVKVSVDRNVLKLASEYEKDPHMIARMIVQIRKSGTYKENNNWQRYK